MKNEFDVYAFVISSDFLKIDYKVSCKNTFVEHKCENK